jgi:epoxyqueuosine reductase
MEISIKDLSTLIKAKAKEAGFYKAGIAKAEKLIREGEYLRNWLDEDHDADMKWIANSFEKRIDPALQMEDVKSVISLAYIYDSPFAHPDDENIPKISRYAWGKRDYHKVLKKKLKLLSQEIESISPEIIAKYFIDDAPVMDKAWAVRAGIGAMGKNTNVLIPEAGSFFFIANIFVNIHLEYDEPLDDLCQSCRICIDSCPTGAIYDDYKLNSDLCISYQTIENRNEIPDEINLNGWVFGCDICQDVCPYNGNKIFTEDENFFPRPELLNKNYDEFEILNEEEYNKFFEGTPIRRAKYKGFIRNIKKAKSEKIN